MLKEILKKGTVVVVKINTTEEVIGKLVNDVAKSGFVKLSKPLLVRPLQNQDGNIGLSFMPYTLTAGADEQFSFSDKDYVAIFEPRKDIADAYTAQTSPLDIPKKSGLIMP